VESCSTDWMPPRLLPPRASVRGAERRCSTSFHAAARHILKAPISRMVSVLY
jgi:hypothetical protein